MEVGVAEVAEKCLVPFKTLPKGLQSTLPAWPKTFCTWVPKGLGCSGIFEPVFGPDALQVKQLYDDMLYLTPPPNLYFPPPG